MKGQAIIMGWLSKDIFKWLKMTDDEKAKFYNIPSLAIKKKFIPKFGKDNSIKVKITIDEL